MDRRSNTRFFGWLFFIYGFLQLCSAEDLTCSITQSHGQTAYNVPGVSVPGVNMSEFEFSWSDGTDGIVIANHKDKKDDVVKSGNITTLITSQCFPRIIYQLDCVQQNIHHKVSCTIVCNPESVKSKATTEPTKISPFARLVLLLLLVLTFCLP